MESHTTPSATPDIWDGVGELVLRAVPDGRVYIDAVMSPVVEYIRTAVDDDDREIRRGRLWVEMKFWDDAGELVEKPAELAKWYSRLAGWVRRHLERADAGGPLALYWSPSIRELVEQGYHLL